MAGLCSCPAETRRDTVSSRVIGGQCVHVCQPHHIALLLIVTVHGCLDLLLHCKMVIFCVLSVVLAGVCLQKRPFLQQVLVFPKVGAPGDACMSFPPQL